MRACAPGRAAADRPLSRRSWRAALVVAALLAAAPAPAEEEGCTLPGAGGWRSYQSRHFLVDVSAPGHQPAQVVGTLEVLREAVLKALVAEPVEIAGRARVIVLPSRLDVETYAGRRRSSFYGTLALDPAQPNRGEPAAFWISSLGEPVILLAYQDLTETPQAVAHELAHYLSLYLYPRQPPWFREGLAQFLEGVARTDAGGRRWAGLDPTAGQAALIKLSGASKMMARTTHGFDDDPYRTAFLLYRFLWNERSAQLTDYQRRLSSGESPSTAWEAAFPEWSAKAGLVDRIDPLLAAHQASGRGARWEVKVDGVERAYQPLPVSTADLHMRLLEPKLAVVNDLLRDALRLDETWEALEEEPGHPVATAVQARLEGKDLRAALRPVAASRPGDGRAWFLLAGALADPAEREAALRRAAAAWPDGADAQSALADLLASTGRAREGLAFANRGLDLAPWSPDAMAALARVAAGQRSCKAAMELQARAADAAEEGAPGTVRTGVQELRRRLEALRATCAAGGP